MPVQNIPIEHFLSLAKHHPVIDVRSPAEFLHAHIPCAYNLPIFTDEERKVVGTAYKQQSRQQAIKIGLDYFGVKMRKIVEQAEVLITDRKLRDEKSISTHTGQSVSNLVLIHCWRGGMRSAALAWLLDLAGFKVYTLSGGYKAFRNWVLQRFEKPGKLNILGGYTGSGKTILLQQLQRSGQRVINLEALANHKGSAFGALGQVPQPSQEMFENLLGLELFINASPTPVVQHDPDNGKNAAEDTGTWIEDESQRIGVLNIPLKLWEKMRNSPVYFIDIPFKERLNNLVESYGNFPKEDLINAVSRIRKRLGGLETGNAVSFLSCNDIEGCFSILLKYYDKWYSKGLNNRTNLDALLHNIPCATVSENNVAFLSPATREPAPIT